MALTSRRIAAIGIATGLGFAAAVPSSQAALGTAPRAALNGVPDLVSVTTDRANELRFTFDEAVDPGPAFAASSFRVGGYAAAQLLPTPAGTTVTRASTDTRTVIVRYQGLSENLPDFENATFGTVAPNAVTAQNGGSANLADSTRLTGSTSRSGTRGNTAGPDLQGVTVSSDSNSITYTFDQKLDRTTIDRTQFGFVRANGDSFQNGLATTFASDYAVQVRFPAQTQVEDAVRAFTITGAVQSRTAGSSGPQATFTNPGADVVVPGSNGSTANPDLLSATLSASGDFIDYVFDTNVTNPNAAAFTAYSVTSNGTTAAAPSNPVVVNGNTVRVSYNQNQNNENLVFAGANAGAVTSQNGRPSTVAGKPVGGNAGALASGYTTAPDALSATFDNTSGIVGVTFDSRLIPAGVNPGQFALIDASGNPLGTASSVLSAGTSASPIQPTVQLQFDPDVVRAASALTINGNNAGGTVGLGGSGVVGTIAGGPLFATLANRYNVIQIVGKNATAASVAPVGTKASALKLRPLSTAGVLPAKYRSAGSVSSPKQAAANNLKAIRAYNAKNLSVKKVAIKKGAVKPAK